jgi:hypothetical protein
VWVGRILRGTFEERAFISVVLPTTLVFDSSERYVVV